LGRRTVSVPINIPKLGVSMSEGTLVEWLVSDGDQVTEGQLLYRIETDKVENDVEAPVAGVIRITGEEGETYAVGDPIGEIET
jgi:pyruvate/2-oxoglutarate dehydrogenase complex dihydrolipoamide acyltransferase (E2) component